MDMLNARDALRVPTAQITDNERKEAEALLDGLRAYIREHLLLSGMEMLLETTNRNVIAYINAEMNDPVREWIVEWEIVGERSRVDPNRIRPLGYKIKLAPKHDAVRDAIHAPRLTAV